jgi:DNA mismatch repair protein MutS2
MFQCGMLVPMSENSVIGKFNHIFLDMGDDQSIDNDLSTYSSHLNNMKFFIKNAKEVTLLLIDEFGSGTEPTMGGAIAESVLEKLNGKKCFGVITTHYANLKHFAASQEGIVNGAMLYDHNKLEPLFKLEMGKPGNSFAFEIARKLGMPEDVLQIASGKVGQDYMNFEKHIREALRDKRYWERKRQQIRKNEKKLESELEKTREELDSVLKQKKEIIRDAKAEAKSILENANKQIENTIREIKEARAEKEKTRQSRERIENSKKQYENTWKDKEEEQWLARKKKKIEQRLKKRGKKLPVDEEQTIKPTLKAGLKVKLEGQDVPGEVLEINGKKAMVAFGNMITSVTTDRLIPVSENEFRRQNKTAGGSEKTYNIYEKRLHFKAQVDIRGKRADEAIQIVSRLVDEALMLRTSEVKILHGKGNGILRQMIRDYLKSVPGIKSFKDEKVEFGGTGITVVNLDTSI